MCQDCICLQFSYLSHGTHGLTVFLFVQMSCVMFNGTDSEIRSVGLWSAITLIQGFIYYRRTASYCDSVDNDNVYSRVNFCLV